MFIHFRRLSWCIIKIQGGPFLESHPTRTYCGFEVEILIPGSDLVLLRRVCQQDPVSTQGGMDEKKRSTQIWLRMIHKKHFFKKNRLERSQRVRKYRISELHEGLRSCPPLDQDLGPPWTTSQTEFLRLWPSHVTSWVQELYKGSKRTHLYRKYL